MLGMVLFLVLISLLSLLPLQSSTLAATALMLGMLVVAWKLYERSSRTATPGERALNFGLMANGMAVGVTMLVFLSVPTGISGRPMALPLFYFAFGLAMTVIGIGKAVRAWSPETPLAISALALCLSIFPIELLTVLAVACTKAYEFEP